MAIATKYCPKCGIGLEWLDGSKSSPHTESECRQHELAAAKSTCEMVAMQRDSLNKENAALRERIALLEALLTKKIESHDGNKGSEYDVGFNDGVEAMRDEIRKLITEN